MKKLKVFLLSIMIIIGFIGCSSAGDSLNVEHEEGDSLVEKWSTSLETGNDLLDLQQKTILALDIQKDNESIFQVSYVPKPYKAAFNNWEIFQPYKNEAVVDTEELHRLLAYFETLPTEKSTQKLKQLKNTTESLFIAYDDQSDGFAKGDMTPNKSMTLHFLEDEESNVYINIDGTEFVYEVPSFLKDEFLDLQPFDYVLNIPTVVMIDEVENIEISTPEQEILVTKNDEQWEIEGQALSEQVLEGLYIKLLDVMVAGEVSDEYVVKKEIPELTIVFNRINDYPAVVEEYYVYDEDHLRVSVNGVSNFIVNKHEVLEIFKLIDDL